MGFPILVRWHLYIESRLLILYQNELLARFPPCSLSVSTWDPTEAQAQVCTIALKLNGCFLVLLSRPLSNFWVVWWIWHQISWLQKFVGSYDETTYRWVTRGQRIPDSKVHVARMGHTRALSVPGGPHVGPMNLAIRDESDWSPWRSLTHTRTHISSAD